MVLSSQSPRGVGGRGYTSSRRKSRARLKATLILIVAVGVGWFLFFRGGGAETPTTTQSGETVNETAITGDVDAEPDPRPNLSDVLSSRSDTPAPEPTPNPAEDPAPSQTTPSPDLSGVEARLEPASTPSPRITPGPASSREARRQLAEGFELINNGNAVAGRALLSTLLLGARDQLSDADADRIRARLSDLNARLVFSPEAVPNDTATSVYTVQSGDLLGSIGRRTKVPYPFLELINGIDARRLRLGQPLKLINGPVHARVDKSEFVMDVYVFGSDGTPAFLTSFPVGLGENDNTPLGKWRVASGKVTNPDWRNPRTNEYYPADHPDNPIGEYWVPITGLEGDAVGRTGFGIHGTNEPDSIGQNMSMGCVRLGDADIAMVYSMLQPGESEIHVVP
ncbi:MAG: L,D-transpeptidase family protein [Planctomycetota bacterium]